MVVDIARAAAAFAHVGEVEIERVRAQVVRCRQVDSDEGVVVLNHRELAVAVEKKRRLLSVVERLSVTFVRSLA